MTLIISKFKVCTDTLGRAGCCGKRTGRQLASSHSWLSVRERHFPRRVPSPLCHLWHPGTPHIVCCSFGVLERWSVFLSSLSFPKSFRRSFVPFIEKWDCWRCQKMGWIVPASRPQRWHSYMYFKVAPPPPLRLRERAPQLRRLAWMVKDFHLNLDALQRFRRILPQMKSRAAKTAAKWGFQLGYLFI